MRSFLLGAKTEVKTLPYDAEVEYLESVSEQWIRTPYSYTGAEQVVVFNLDVTNTFSQSPAYFVGSSSTYNPRLLQVSNFWRATCDPSGSTTVFSMSYVRHTINVVYDVAGTITASLDGGTPVSVARNFYTTPGSSLDLMGANGASFKRGKYYSFKATVDGSVVVDMIPVRVGQVGYMYDRVSGRLFGNSGTGDFILGPDKEVA